MRTLLLASLVAVVGAGPACKTPGTQGTSSEGPAPAASEPQVPPAASPLAAATEPLPPAVASPLPSYSWERYGNGRFGFRVDVPTFMTAKPSPANGDGQGWTWGTRASLSASGMHNASEMTIGEWFKSAQDRHGITGKAQRENWFMVTGIDDSGMIFWEKTILSEGILFSLSFSYERQLKDAFDAIVEHTNTSWHVK